MTAEEKERFLARARAEGRTLTSAEMYTIFGPPPEAVAPTPAYSTVTAMSAAPLDAVRLTQLQANFFPELGGGEGLRRERLLRGVIFDFDHTLAFPTRPLAYSMEDGANAAVAYMLATGMTLPADFATQVVEARRFAEEKSAEEREEHLADDALEFPAPVLWLPGQPPGSRCAPSGCGYLLCPGDDRVAVGARRSGNAARAPKQLAISWHCSPTTTATGSSNARWIT